MSTHFTIEDVSHHNKEGDLYIIIDSDVYDLSKFAKLHPGGKNVLLQVAGTDASEQFWQFHNKAILNKYKERLLIGKVAGKTADRNKEKAQPTSVKQEAEVSTGKSRITKVLHEQFGTTDIPFSEPAWYLGSASPYYNESHKKFRDAIRIWVAENIEPYAHAWDEQKSIDKTIWKKFADAGFLGGAAGAPWRPEFAGSKVGGGIRPEEYDYFHEQILLDELCKAGSGGATWGIIAGINIGLPPILEHGSDELKKRVAVPVLHGEKVICLAITEPAAGSDVAGLKTSAVKTPDGKHYIVNGEKKWITNGVYADFFTVAVRTGGSGQGGVSLLLIERGPGVTTRQMNCQGVWASGTTYITFENVKVPVENLIGKENQGFLPIMTNFNHERWGIIVQANRFSRVLLEEAIRYAMKRKTFGKRLIDHPVIRLKIAHMASMIESVHAWMEQITFQLNTLPKKEAMQRLGGPVALLKLRSTQTFEFCAREASQIFGGLAYTRGGQGEKVERLYREVRAYAIPGGSEEIMADAGVKQALKVTGVKI